MVIQRPERARTEPGLQASWRFLFFLNQIPKTPLNYRAKELRQHLELLWFGLDLGRRLNRLTRGCRRNDLLRRYGALSNLH